MKEDRELEGNTEARFFEKQIANFEDVFLNNRNQSWIPVIEDLIKKQPTFIAVGAAHLGGNKGVISLLKSKGYIVEPVF